MRYTVFLVDYADKRWEDLTEAEQAEWMAQHEAFDAVVAAREGCTIVAGEALTGGDSATVLRPVGGDVVLTDGPYTEATEAIGGFYVIEAPDLDVLTDLVRSLPFYVMEIRPVAPF